MIIWAIRNGGRRFLSFHYHSSANAALSQADTNFLVDYLTNKLGFCEQEALRFAAKVNPEIPRRNPDLVVGYLKTFGLNDSDIKRILLSRPSLIFYHVRKTLQPKIAVLQDLGLSGSDITRVLRCYRSFLWRGLNSDIKPPIQYLRNLLGTDENVVRAIQKYSCVIHVDVPKITGANVVLLKKAGFSNEKVLSFILENPRAATRKFTGFESEETMQKVEHDFGISPMTKMFNYLVVKLMSTSKLRQAKTFEVLRSFGWSDSMIYLMIGKLPALLGLTEDSLVKKLNFFMGELGYSIEYLASHPMFLSFSLEKRVKPRFEVLRALHEKKLCMGFCFYTVVCIRESRFIDEFLVPFRDEISDVYESYFSIVGKKH